MKNLLPKPTKEMISHFLSRTKKHIERVQKNMEPLDGFMGVSKKDLIERGKTHDADKFSKEFVIPYIWITEYHKAAREDRLTEDLKKIFQNCRSFSYSHVLANRHHPEHHSELKNMTDLDLIEMVCDWTAMAQELNEPSAKGWADKKIGTVWNFTLEQTNKIYKIINETIKIGLV